jgi:CRP-like cAMP-binding protein
MELSRFYFVNNFLYEFIQQDEGDIFKNVIVQKNYTKGKHIFTEGDYPNGVFILTKGKLKIYQTTLDGAHQIMNIHIAGEIVGYRPLLCDEKYPVTATAIEDSMVSFIPKNDFINALGKSTVLSSMLLKFLSHEFTVWVNTISNLKHRTVKERLMLNLLILIEKYSTQKKWPIQITLSRADLAALIGTSNETLARLLKTLKDEKWIATKGRIVLVNSAVQVDKIRRSILGSF